MKRPSNNPLNLKTKALDLVIPPSVIGGPTIS
jgi:hypothetical protein